MSEVLQNLFRGAGPDSGDSPITPKNNIEVLKRQFLEAEPPKYAKTTRIEFGSTTFSAVDSDSEVGIRIARTYKIRMYIFGLSVCLYPINVKIVDPIGPFICVSILTLLEKKFLKI